MSIRNKIIELSISIISLVGLVFNILFPQAVLAKSNYSLDALTFDISNTVDFLPFVLAKGSSSLDSIVGINDIIPEKEEKKEVVLSSVEPVIEKNKEVKLVLVEPETGSDNDEIAKKICEEAGLGDLPCWQDLKAMRQKESYDGKAMVGDDGRSRGWYHIQTKLHNISVECAMDFECSTEWTVKNLIAHKYETNRFYAISKHNGGGKKAQAYAKSVINNSAKFED